MNKQAQAIVTCLRAIAKSDNAKAGKHDVIFDGAADEIERLNAALVDLADAEALSGVRAVVAGWNGEGRDEPYKERHPSRLGATLPKTTCGAVYALDEALQRARVLVGQKRGCGE